MEFELGLKLTRAPDEFTSDFRIATDRTGPVFSSQETEAMFILTALLKGYRRKNLKIDINEDGTSIGIIGERKAKEIVIVGSKVVKKDAEIKGFEKVFRIPDGVILDEIKARFNDESTLTITMPKKVKGIQGTVIEEIKEKPELVKESSGSLQIVGENVERTEVTEKEKIEEKQSEAYKPDVQNEREVNQGTDSSPNVETFPGREVPPVETRVPEEEKQDLKTMSEIKEDKEHDQPETNKQHSNTVNDNQEERKKDEQTAEDRPPESEIKEDKENNQPETTKQDLNTDRPREERFKMCIPIIAGSTLLLSFVVFVFQIIRNKNQSSRRRD